MKLHQCYLQGRLFFGCNEFVDTEYKYECKKQNPMGQKWVQSISWNELDDATQVDILFESLNTARIKISHDKKLNLTYIIMFTVRVEVKRMFCLSYSNILLRLEKNNCCELQACISDTIAAVCFATYPTPTKRGRYHVFSQQKVQNECRLNFLQLKR